LLDNKSSRLTPAQKDLVKNKTTEQTGEVALLVEPPFTIEVDIKRLIGGQQNDAKIKIYNLNEKTRAQLFKDRFIASFVGNNRNFFLRKVIIEAGYGKKLYPIFIGSLLEGYSLREGTEQITYLHCVSSAVGLYNTFINQSYEKNTSYQKVLEDTIAKLEESGDVKKGTISIVDGKHETGTIAMGEAFSVMSKYGVEIFIDLNKINLISQMQALQSIIGKIPVISAETGLIETPIRSGNYVIVKTMLEPSIRLGELVELKTETARYFSGQYKVYGVEHQGIFSITKEGKMITTLKLWVGDKALGSWQVL